MRDTGRGGVAFAGAVAVAFTCAGVVFSQGPSPTATPTPAPTPNTAQPAPATTPTPGPTATPRSNVTPSPTATPSSAYGNPGTQYQSTYRPCHEAALGREKMLDATRRRLYETICGATLWLDGLFGRHGSVAAAEEVTGHAELSVLRSSVAGTKVKTGLDVNFTLPHLEEKLHAFLGRSDPDEYVRDRQEGFGLRSEFVSLESEEKWLGGLGYSLPGANGQNLSFRTGVAGGIHATVFGQGIYQRNIAVGESNLWYLREVGFWRNRGEGFGFTSSADYDHVVNDNMLLRWGTIGTVSQGIRGLDWRTALVLYQNLHQSHALAYEVFLRGVTSTLGLTEYGPRLIYRQSAFRRWFFIDTLLGYSWLRLNPGEPHQGSVVYGLGGELWFGPPTE
ncbi:MAG: hypothetical protein ACHQQS_03575 [Thermoanaerobaculales bacterium]